jgi:ribonuclease Z
MKRFLFATLFLLVAFVSFGQIKVNKDSSLGKGADIKVTLLGTGTPQPLMDRFGPSILVQAGSETLLFDAGRGCLQRLRQINVSYDQINALFLTHLHSDHIVGLPDLWLTGWLLSNRLIPLHVFGPSGTDEMIKYLQKAYAFDIGIRAGDDRRSVEGSRLLTKEIQQGVVYERNGVKVIAFKVDHHPDIPAFGYRVEYLGRSVVLSGDTRYSENLISFSKGADLLIHEVVSAPDTLSKSDPRYPILAHHTTPEQAARVFNEVKPKLAVYSHISKLSGHTEEEIMRRTKINYPGPTMMGEDLMSFSVGDSVAIAHSPNRGN